jgi:hypothetical protein
VKLRFDGSVNIGVEGWVSKLPLTSGGHFHKRDNDCCGVVLESGRKQVLFITKPNPELGAFLGDNEVSHLKQSM